MKMKAFQVRPEILRIFYNSVICGVWRYCLICWGGNVRLSDREILDSIVRRAGRIIGESLEGVGSVYRGLVGQGLHRVLSEESHPLHDRLAGQESLVGSGRLRLPLLRTNRYRDFFTIRAIRLHNERMT